MMIGTRGLMRLAVGLSLTAAIFILAIHVQADNGKAQDGGQTTGQPPQAGDKSTNRTTVNLEGLSRPSRRVELAFPVAGILTKRLFTEGQQVDQGQAIAELDAELEKAVVRIDSLKAESDCEIRAAEATALVKAELLERKRSSAQQGSSAVWEVREAELGVQLAKAQVEMAKFQKEVLAHELKRDEILVAQRQIKAPFSGSIWRTLKEEGEAVERLQGIAVLVQLNPLWVELNAPAEYFGHISVGQEAKVTIRDVSRPATVSTVEPMVDAGSGTFRVRLTLPNEDQSLVAGIRVTAQFDLVGLATRPASPQTAQLPAPRTTRLSNPGKD